MNYKVMVEQDFDMKLSEQAKLGKRHAHNFRIFISRWMKKTKRVWTKPEFYSIKQGPKKLELLKSSHSQITHWFWDSVLFPHWHALKSSEQAYSTLNAKAHGKKVCLRLRSWKAFKCLWIKALFFSIRLRRLRIQTLALFEFSWNFLRPTLKGRKWCLGSRNGQN